MTGHKLALDKRICAELMDATLESTPLTENPDLLVPLHYCCISVSTSGGNAFIMVFILKCIGQSSQELILDAFPTKKYLSI